MYWPAIGLAQAQYRIYYRHGIGSELFNQCHGNEHMPLCAPAYYQTSTISGGGGGGACYFHHAQHHKIFHKIFHNKKIGG